MMQGEVVSPTPTQNLFIAISGQGASLLQSDVLAALKEYGACDQMRLLIARPIVVATYDTVEKAQSVKAATDGRHCMRLGRVLRAEFALDSAIPSLFAAATDDAQKPTVVAGMCVAAEDVPVPGLVLKREWISQAEAECVPHC